jgi:hypothetical protein
MSEKKKKICYTGSMVEGTKPFKGKKSPHLPSSEPTSESVAENPAPAPDATNLDRRAWFSALVPAFGDGLVKILRASNNLQQDLREAARAKAEQLKEPEPAPAPPEEKKGGA